MTTIQRMMTALLPRAWADSMRRQSETWRFRCCSCGNSRSVWDAGGVRWHAASLGKRKLIHCPRCGRLRWAAVEWTPDFAEPAAAPIGGPATQVGSSEVTEGPPSVS